MRKLIACGAVALMGVAIPSFAADAPIAAPAVNAVAMSAPSGAFAAFLTRARANALLVSSGAAPGGMDMRYAVLSALSTSPVAPDERVAALEYVRDTALEDGSDALATAIDAILAELGGGTVDISQVFPGLTGLPAIPVPPSTVASTLAGSDY